VRRVATIPALRQAQGADAFGGLIEFRDKLPIRTKHGDDGWLGFHLAACFGQLNADPEARLTWIFERDDLWHAIARDPLANIEWAGLEVKDPGALWPQLWSSAPS
jgi:DNA-directed RNA polymerase